MDWINYHHLQYFWLTAREGSLGRAAATLHRTQATLSGQIRTLERDLGVKLFQKAGRQLAMTDQGRVAFRYADEIFGTGRELLEALRGRAPDAALEFSVGVADSIPKLVAYRMLAPVLAMKEPVRLKVYEDRPDWLLGRLSVHELDLVISDSPVPPTVSVRAYNHLLGECGVTFFAPAARAKALRRGFPRTLDREPFLLPLENTTLSRGLEQFWQRAGVRPRIVGAFEDSALLKTFAQAGRGAFAGPSLVEREVCRQHGVAVIGRAPEIVERFYGISVERKVTHPAVVAVNKAARSGRP
ncbi:MAG: transcriptional activator NhaR [Planctomycetes bacterium]|nr:transcriptional activator NhaR [Planctomycetota bacterium]